LGVNLLLSLGALALAAASLVLVENPIRHHRGLRSRPRRGLAVGAVLTVGTAVVALLVSLAPSAIRSGATVDDVPVAMAAAAEPDRLLSELIAKASRTEVLPANVTPPLAKARADKPESYANQCHLNAPAVQAPGPCEYGDPAGTRTVVLFGDSHAAQWFPTLQELARRHGWRLLSRTKSACSAADVLQYNTLLKRAYTECQSWRRRELARLRTLAPDMIVVSSSFQSGQLTAEQLNPPPPGGEAEIWRAGWRRTLRALAATGAAVSFLVDTPFLRGSPADCLARHPKRTTTCAEPVAQVLLNPRIRAAVAAEARAAGAQVIDPTPWLCTATCPVVLGNLLVYRDANHLTTGYARMLAPLLYARLPKPTD
ncbi:MAG TPA: SGNH hydrolase domain-containing protein, partial [Actinoplanes sp.]|nr:SGNH hydrolase domain-containing protein [Actinoplanes sp.]